MNTGTIRTLLVAVGFLLASHCTNLQSPEPQYSDVFVGNWTQVKNYYKGPPDHLSTMPYAGWEINMVSRTRWLQYINMGDTVVCTKWYYFVSNDTLARSLDNSTFNFVGTIAKVNDTIVIDEGSYVFWHATYGADTLPSYWSKTIVYRP